MALASGGAAWPMLDVRSPKEFMHGHIPGATNMPLFDNEGRAEVGTIYKQKGKQPAILRGLELVGPNMASMAELGRTASIDNTIFVHCWRGGMRSGSVAWLLESYGLKVFTLKGGYKAFRNYVQQQFAEPKRFVVLGGRTGSRKTQFLHSLRQQGEQIIDLEGLAHHKGSAFGTLGEKPQPTQEQFENTLGLALRQLDPAKHTWIEDESRTIGTKVIPGGLWDQMRDAQVISIQQPLEERVEYLTQEYGKFPAEQLREAITRIGKRLGPQHMKDALIALDAADLRTVCRICLQYYDRSYDYGLSQRPTETVHNILYEHQFADSFINELIVFVNTF